MFTVNAIGIGMYHQADSITNRPRGSGDYLFVHFLSRHKIWIEGFTRLEDPGGCVIFPPDCRQEYGGDGINAFGNDWFHFTGPDVGNLLEQMRLPLNSLFRPRSSTFIPAILREINWELMNREPHWEFSVSLRVQRFFLELSRAVNSSGGQSTSRRLEELQERMHRLRQVMQERCVERWTLERMMRYVHLSRSRFISLYKRLFGRAPIDDLIEMRLTLAKHYLSNSSMTVTEVADACGFGDVYYFCRQFKTKTGCTPGSFREAPAG